MRSMTKEMVIDDLCTIVHMVHQSKGGFSDGKACDCFCSFGSVNTRSFAFERPDILDFIRKAVEEKLVRERAKQGEDADREWRRGRDAVIK